MDGLIEERAVKCGSGLLRKVSFVNIAEKFGGMCVKHNFVLQGFYILAILGVVPIICMLAFAQSPDPPELVAVQHGVSGIRAFVKSGGNFTDFMTASAPPT